MGSSSCVNVNTIIRIDSKFYNAAAKGEIGPFEDYTKPLNLLLTPTKNTVLHIHITQQTKGNGSVSFVERVLAKCPSLLLQTNNLGETPLHIAASHGLDAIVRSLIDLAKAKSHDIESGAGAAKMMLRMESTDKETALHEAVRHNNPVVVQILTEEDPDYTYSANQAGETPLYLAVERGYSDMVFRIIDTFNLPAYDGPNGRTALHEAVIRNNPELIKKIISAKKTLAKVVDQQGWTPLHHASHFGNDDIVNQLLECDKSAAYVGDKNGMTPLHLAVARGESHMAVVFSILKYCPDCHELVDHKRRNVLHFAMQSSSTNLLFDGYNQDSLYLPSLTKLINQKDVDGNTPLHLLSTYCYNESSLICHPLADKMAVNNSNFTPLDVVLKNTEDHSVGTKGLILRSMKNCGGYKQSLRNLIEVKDEKPQVIDIQVLERTKTSHMIVAALIATVTFTAGFTMPGGYDDKKGFALMSRNGAFAVFVITDTLALLLSVCALFFHYLLDFDDMTRRRKEEILVIAALFILVSFFLMIIAFTAAVFAVLHDATYLRVIICVLAAFSFVICYKPLKQLFIINKDSALDV